MKKIGFLLAFLERIYYNVKYYREKNEIYFLQKII